MTAAIESTPRWDAKRTQETRTIEDRLKQAGFQRADAYRYNSASIRVRVIDPRFAGKSEDERDRMVEEILKQLPTETQADIMSLMTFAPEEVGAANGNGFVRNALLNLEFEDPSPSRL